MSASTPRGNRSPESRPPSRWSDWPWGLCAAAIVAVFVALFALAWWSAGAGQLHDPFTYRLGG